MFFIIGLICSCTVTGFVFFEIMGALYEKRYDNRLIYTITLIAYIFVGAGVAWLKIPLLNIVFSLIALCGLSLTFYCTNEKNVIIHSSAIIIYLAIVDMITTTIFSIAMNISTYDSLQSPKLFLLSSIGNIIVILCTYKLLIQILLRYQISYVSKILHIYMVFLMIFEFAILCYFVQNDRADTNNFHLLVMCLGFIILDAGILYLYKMICENARFEKNAELVEQQLEITTRYYDELRESQEMIKRQLHDTKKHLQVINSLENKLLKEEYASELIEVLENINPQFICSDGIVSAIIWNKMQICECREIEFSVNMQDISFGFMSKVEITALFANLLDNAVEACESSRNENKQISLRIHSFKHYVVIKMNNTIGETPKFKNKKLISTKQGHWGLGMSILEELANKYGGNVDYDYSNEYFETKIILSTCSGEET